MEIQEILKKLEELEEYLTYIQKEREDIPKEKKNN